MLDRTLLDKEMISENLIIHSDKIKDLAVYIAQDLYNKGLLNEPDQTDFNEIVASIKASLLLQKNYNDLNPPGSYFSTEK